MLFGVTFIFCLFAVPSVSVGDRDPVRGEIVEVRSDRLDSYVSCRYSKVTIPNSAGVFSIELSTPRRIPIWWLL